MLPALLKVQDTVPGIKGATASAQVKPATLETGKVLQVPLFVEPGDKVKVDTRTGDYITRVSSGIELHLHHGCHATSRRPLRRA